MIGSLVRRQPRTGRRFRGGDRGSSVGFVAIAVSVGGAIALVAAALTGLTVARTKATGAADLTALAVAARLFEDPDPCSTGAVIARANNSDLVACAIVGAAAEVAVTTALPGWLRHATGQDSVTGEARAEVVAEAGVFEDRG